MVYADSKTHIKEMKKKYFLRIIRTIVNFKIDNSKNSCKITSKNM